MAVLKYYKNGEWQKVNAPINEVTPESIGAIAEPDVVSEGQALIFDGVNWVAGEAGASVPVSDTEPTGAETGDLWLDTSAETYSKQYIIAPENPQKGQTLVYNGSTWVARDDKMTVTLSVTINEQGTMTDFGSSSHTFGQIKAALDEGMDVILKMISSDNRQQFGYLCVNDTLMVGFLTGMVDIQFHSDNTITSELLGIQ